MNSRYLSWGLAPKFVLALRVFFLLFWIFPAITHTLFAQVPDLKMHYFSDDQGLHTSHINDIVQDSSGYIWVASRDGLFKYDAYGFKGYYADESDTTTLSSSLVNCLFVDGNGILWVGTQAGLHKYHSSGDNFIRVSLMSEELNTDMPSISQIGIDHQGNLLVSTGNQISVAQSPEGEFEILILMEEGEVTRFQPDSMGGIWIGSSDNHGLKRYNSKGDIEELKVSSQDEVFLSGLNVTDLILQESKLWITTLGAGVIKYDPDTGEVINLPGRTWDEGMTVGCYQDRAGNIWTIDYAGIKVRRDINQVAGEFYPLSGDEETVRRGVSNIFEDKQGNYWVYHRTNGLGISVKSKGFNRLDAYAREFLFTEDLDVSCISEDEGGSLWLGQSEGGVLVYNWQEWTIENYSHNPQDPYSLGRGAVNTIYRDSRGTMWIGTYFDGLQYFQESTGRFITFRHDPDNPQSISGNDIRSIAEDEEGKIWIAVHGKGVDSLDPQTGRFSHYNSANNGLSNDWTFQLLFDREGGLWAGSAWGLNYMEKGSGQFVNYFRVDESPGSLSDNYITSLHLDAKDRLWVGTQNGLNHYLPESGSFNRYLSSGRYSYISGIVSDKEMNLWVSYRSGLLKIDPESGEPTNYGPADGLHSDGYNVRSVYRNNKGEFFFGGNKGVDLFRPSDLHANLSPPGIVIDQVRILDREGPVESAGTPVSIIPNPSGTIVLRPSQFMITLSFKALNFINPEKNRYETLLEGLDSDWHVVGTNKEVSYTNLNAGTYTFRVRGSNNDGVWSTTDAILEIKVLPSWYETWFFRITLILSILAGISLLIAFRTAQLRTRANRLNQVVLEKTGELQKKTEELELKNNELEKSNKTKDKLMSIIAHDLVNPFNSLIGMSDLLMKRSEKLDAATRRQYTELINNSAQSAFDLLQNLLAWARSQTGRIKQVPEYLDLKTIIQEIINLNMANLGAKSIHVKSACPGNVKVWGDREMISTILRNLVNNSIKFVPSGGDISISARKENGKVRIEIKDNGVGMSPEKVKEILSSDELDPTTGTGGEKGSGIGLNLCKEFIRQHGGKLEIQSEEGKGSTFSFTLPEEVEG